MAVRLKDIAQELGVSVVTVSKVLRGQPDIGEQTRSRITVIQMEKPAETMRKGVFEP